MKNLSKVALAATLSAAIIAACSDSGRVLAPSTSRPFPGARLNVMGTCTTIDQLQTLANQVFIAGSPNVNSVLGKLDNLRKKVEAGNEVDAQAQANNIVSFVREKAAEGMLAGTQEQITQFISGVLCYAGLSPDTFLILPSDEPQVRVSSEGTSGVSLEGNTVNEPTLLTLTTLDPNGPSPLITELDQYPSYVSITTSSGLTKPAVVAVCPLGDIPAEVRARLRLGHQAAAGFEITPPANADFLPCATSTASLRTGPSSWVNRIASLFRPKLLYAAEMESGGVGGSVTEFSPFGAVDTELGFSGGGVGGSATEFIRSEPSGGKSKRTASVPSDRLNARARSRSTGVTAVSGGLANLESDVCTEVSATVGTELSAACRPSITITTHNGHVLEGVPVAWAVTLGGGSIAPNTVASQTCGTFDQAAATATDANGQVGICWTMGPEGGTNNATAIPSAGGDAPAGVTFKPARLLFTATGLKITPTATATGGTFVYDNEAHAGSGTCSHDLTPALSYSGGAVPVAAGSYTLSVTCGANSNVYNEVTATAVITIEKHGATATAGSATINFGSPVPTMPCAVSGLLSADAGSVTCTTSTPTVTVAGSYPTTPVVSPADPANYSVALVNGTLTVAAYVQYGCFSSPIYSVMPPTKSAQRKGSNLPVKCSLMTPQGAPVTTATGDIVVEDRGTTGTASPLVVFSANNVFKYSTGGNYAYGLDTSEIGFVAGHYYYVTARWNDGSTTTGWFLLK